MERERFRLDDEQPGPGHREPQDIGTVIPGLLQKMGLGNQHWLWVLSEEWPQLVGEAVAGHTRPGRFEDGTLTVFVDSSVWLSELKRYGVREMLANLKKRFGGRKIRSINLCLDPDPRES